MSATSTARLSPDAVTAPPADDVSTRYLCAGAHLDRLFARDVLRSVLRQPHRAVGPSYGIDTGLVIRHCVYAYRRRLLRDLVLAAVAVTVIWAYLSLRPRLVLALLVVAWGVVLLEAAVAHFEVLAARLHPRQRDLRLPTDPRLRARLAEIELAQAVNVTVYSGYGAFVGSGVDLGAWSITVDLARGKDDVGARRVPKPLDIAALRERVVSAVLATGVEGLSVSEGLYVDGDCVGGGRLPIQPHGPHTRPVGYVPPAVVRQYVDTTSPACRHYHRIQVTAWGGEIVLSIFVRFRVVRDRLYAEATYCYLPPVSHPWRVIDRLRPTPTVGQALKLTGRALRDVLPALAYAIPRTLGEAWVVWVKEPLNRAADKAAARDGTVVDYGALLTVRQRGAAKDFRRYFQKLDHEMCVKLLEQAILDTVVTVLDECDVDTSDLVERQGTILNQGVLMTGGSLQAESLAVGRDARVSAASEPAASGRAGKISARVRRAVSESRKA